MENEIYYDGDDETIKLIEEGQIGHYKYIITSLGGSHPCAYIVLDKYDSKYKKVGIGDYDIIHGGITYCDDYLTDLIDEDEEKWVIGWDYAHEGDYVSKQLPYSILISSISDWGNPQGKKYTKQEIKQDIKKLIKELQKNSK